MRSFGNLRKKLGEPKTPKNMFKKKYVKTKRKNPKIPSSANSKNFKLICNVCHEPLLYSWGEKLHQNWLPKVPILPDFFRFSNSINHRNFWQALVWLDPESKKSFWGKRKKIFFSSIFRFLRPREKKVKKILVRKNYFFMKSFKSQKTQYVAS